MSFNGLTQEQWDKLRECKTPEDILALTQAEGYELTDVELEKIAGYGDGYTSRGSLWSGPEYTAWCPHCGKQYYFYDPEDPPVWCPHCAGKLK